MLPRVNGTLLDYTEVQEKKKGHKDAGQRLSCVCLEAITRDDGREML